MSGIIFSFEEDEEAVVDDFEDLAVTDKLWRFVGKDKNVWFKLKVKEIENGTNAISLFSSDNNFSYERLEEAENFLEFIRNKVIPHTDEKYRLSRRAVFLITEKLRLYLKSSDPILRDAVKSITISEKTKQNYPDQAIHWDFAYKTADCCDDNNVKSVLHACLVEY